MKGVAFLPLLSESKMEVIGMYKLVNQNVLNMYSVIQNGVESHHVMLWFVSSVCSEAGVEYIWTNCVISNLFGSDFFFPLVVHLYKEHNWPRNQNK